MKIRCLKWYRDVYSFVKKHIKSIFPKRILFKNELFFRYPYAIFYLGNSHVCNICSNHLRAFIKLNNSDLMCPFCGSVSRNRRLWHLLNNNEISGHVLHFSPSRSLYKKLKADKKIHYYSSDFENEFIADHHFDITNITQEDEKFDIIICYHILEHIENDKKAISELYRILKPKGLVYIQTPFKEGAIYEDFSIVSPNERLKHFGQSDHVRLYSVDGLKNRLNNNNFAVEERTFQKQDTDFYYGFKSPETVLIASKN